MGTPVRIGDIFVGAEDSAEDNNVYWRVVTLPTDEEYGDLAGKAIYYVHQYTHHTCQVGHNPCQDYDPQFDNIWAYEREFVEYQPLEFPWDDGRIHE